MGAHAAAKFSKARASISATMRGSSDAMHFDDGATLQAMGTQYALALVAEHHMIDTKKDDDPKNDTVDGTQERDHGTIA